MRPISARTARFSAPGDRRRVNNLGSRRWHTDGSYKRLSGKYSLLSCHSVVADGGQTQFADMRAGYDALPDKMKQLVEGLVVEHSIFHSRAVVGFSGFSAEEQASLPSAQHPLVRMHPATRPQIALSVVTCLARCRLADPGGYRPAAGTDGMGNPGLGCIPINGSSAIW